MATFTPVDGDPFAPPAAGGQQPALTPVDGDPFNPGAARFASPELRGTLVDPATPTVSPAEDVLRSAVTGLRRGVVSIPGLPGTIEQLGRMGIDWAGQRMGYDPQTTRGQVLPTSADMIRGDQDPNLTLRMFGRETPTPGAPHYQPQTTAGEYARTVGEFAPGALLPGGIVQRVGMNVAAPAVTSETLGQIAEGTRYEPAARAVGALVGPSIPGLAARIVSPNPIGAERGAMVNTLRNEGVTATTAGQETGRRPLQWLESVTGDMPLAGSRTATALERQGEQFTAAALRRGGITDATRATPEVIDGSFRRIGAVFDDLGARTTVQLDSRVNQAVQDAAANYNRLVPEAMRSPVVQEIVDQVSQFRSPVRVSRDGTYSPGATYGTMGGDQYLALRSRLARDARGTQDPQLSRVLNQFRESLDDAFERSVSATDRAAARTARTEYRNMLVIERAAAAGGENAALGLISPAQLRIADRAVYGREGYTRNRSPFGELERAGVAIMTPLPQSGTAPRAGAQGLLTAAGAAGGAMVGGAPGALGGALAGYTANVLAPGLAGRALMSAPVQGYLRNQVGANAMADLSRFEALAAATPYLGNAMLGR